MKPKISITNSKDLDWKNEETGIDSVQYKNDLQAFLKSSTILEMVSAQVKTTMNTVLGFLNLSKDERLTEQTKGVFTDYIYTSSSGLLQLFTHLIELSQLINGTDNSSMNKIDLNNLLVDLQTKYRAELKYRKSEQHELVLHLPDGQEKQMLNIDRNKLLSILEALLQNAIDFSGQGRIDFGYSIKENSDLEFFFHSAGANFSQEQLESALKTYLNNPCGLDINNVLASIRLEVAKRLVEKLDGKLWSSEQPGKHAGFYFTISGEKQKRQDPGASLLENGHPDWSHKRVLIAEDVDTNFLLLQAMLTPTGMKIDRAVNGMEAVNMFKKNHHDYDLILMDIMMPEMDGFEAASWIKNMDHSIPIIGQTAYCLESEDIAGKLKFFDDFLTKPIWDHELRRMMNKYLIKNG